MSEQLPPPPPASNVPPEALQTNLTLNYWLSAFFSWIPALIFYFVDKGKHPLVDDHNRQTLNFNIIRGGLGLIVSLFSGIPVIGWLIGLVGTIALIVLFVFAIVAAIKGPEAAKAGQTYAYIFNYPFVK